MKLFGKMKPLLNIDGWVLKTKVLNNKQLTSLTHQTKFGLIIQL